MARIMMATINKFGFSAVVLLTMASLTTCFVVPSRMAFSPIAKIQASSSSSSSSSSSLDMIFGKMFEEEGALGKGITVGKVQVALSALDRTSSTSIFKTLEQASREGGSSSSPQQLSKLANKVCLALLRKSDEWVGACSESQWFSANDDTKAESAFNDYANREAAKFEKEYIPGSDSEETPGGPTTVVVSLVIEIKGDDTKFDGAGYSITGTNEVLSSIAGDALVDDGYCVNAVEVFWTPSERDEVLTSRDVIVDFPELIDL
mmetsp:Transcript_19578/g.18784  ORF Transcript_19578/g.18784 Transcript_19578/m.18784 type:complete len:262 (-) Transcript_19578:75-860(-)